MSDATTIPRPKRASSSPRQSAAQPYLMIAAAPDASKVGAVVPIPGDGLTVGRATPEFRRPVDGAAVSLSESWISRAAFALKMDERSVRFDALTDRHPPAFWPDRALPDLVCVDGDATLVTVVWRRGLRTGVDRMGLVGESEAMWALREAIQAAVVDIRRPDADWAPPTPILVVGDTGSGKELVAEAIHQCGPRGTAELIRVNCALLQNGPGAVQLFGSVRGAFTGAAQSTGLFEQLDGGVLFLDEVGDLPPETQVALLRALENGTVLPVGATRPVRFDVQVVAATNRDLEAMVAAGQFREDLLHRLRGQCITVPPLSARLEDVPLLVHHFAGLTTVAHVPIGVAPMMAFIDIAQSGNVRVLRDSVFAAARATQVAKSKVFMSPPAPQQGLIGKLFKRGKKRRPDREALVEAWIRLGFDNDACASHFGVNPATMYEWRKKHLVGRPKATEVKEALNASGGDVPTAAQLLLMTENALRRHAKRLGVEVD